MHYATNINIHCWSILKVSLQQRWYIILWCFLGSGYLTGGHVLRLFHGHMDECLTIPAADQGDDQRRWDTKPYATVCKHTQTANLHHNQSFLLFRNAHYEGGAVCSHARSLWRLEPLRIGSVLFLYSGALTGKKFFSFWADVQSHCTQLEW